MSHTATVSNVIFKDLVLLKKVCDEMGITNSEGTHKLYSTTHSGLGINLPEWRYPVVEKLKLKNRVPNCFTITASLLTFI